MSIGGSVLVITASIGALRMCKLIGASMKDDGDTLFEGWTALANVHYFIIRGSSRIILFVGNLSDILHLTDVDSRVFFEQRSLRLDADERPTCSQLLRHEVFMRDGFATRFPRELHALVVADMRSNPLLARVHGPRLPMPVARSTDMTSTSVSPRGNSRQTPEGGGGSGTTTPRLDDQGKVYLCVPAKQLELT